MSSSAVLLTLITTWIIQEEKILSLPLKMKRWKIDIDNVLTVRNVNLITWGQQIIAWETIESGGPISKLFHDVLLLSAAAIEVGRSSNRVLTPALSFTWKCKLHLKSLEERSFEHCFLGSFLIVYQHYFFQHSFVYPSLQVKMHFC